MASDSQETAFSQEPPCRGLSGEQGDGEYRPEGGRHLASGLDLKLLFPVLGCWKRGTENQGQGPFPCFCFTPSF